MSSDDRRVTAISLGGGVQSTVLTLLAEEGRFGARPDLAIWADTGWDPPSVRDRVEWVAGQVSFPVRVVSASTSLADDTRANRAPERAGGTVGFYAIPAHVTMPDGKKGMTRRTCTRYYKIEPIVAELRRWLGYEPRQRIPVGSAVQWLGISYDELHRMKQPVDPRQKWIERRWPLIDLRMTRSDCYR